jgi:chromosome segregation protein
MGFVGKQGAQIAKAFSVGGGALAGWNLGKRLDDVVEKLTGKGLSTRLAEAFVQPRNDLVEGYRAAKALKEQLLEAAKTRFAALAASIKEAGQTFKENIGFQTKVGTHAERMAGLEVRARGGTEDEATQAEMAQRKANLTAQADRIRARRTAVGAERAKLIEQSQTASEDERRMAQKPIAELAAEIDSLTDALADATNALVELDAEASVLAADMKRKAKEEKDKADAAAKKERERIAKVDFDAAADIADIRKRADEAIKGIMPRGVNVSSLAAVGGYSGGTDRSGITVAERTARATEITAEAVQEMRTRQAEADRERQDKGT